MNYDDLTSKADIRANFIAEAGINHDGSIDVAKQMVDAASEAGADYIKFQSFNAKKLVTPNALTSSYIDNGSRPGESFRELLKRLELDEASHYELRDYCKHKNIKFLSTAFDEESFEFLLTIGIDVVKVASGDLTHLPYLRYMAAAKLPMIVSTGMASLGEIEEALSAIISTGNTKIVLLHCISWYPAEIETTQLRYIETLQKAFGFPVGYSDHTLGINMSIAARALGAVVLEKHFTLDSAYFGPDHAASIEPKQMNDLITGIREVEAGLGSRVRQFCEEELGQRQVHRRSVTTRNSIKAGEVFTLDNLVVKRPGTGIAPKYYDEILGLSAGRDLEPEEPLSWSDVDHSLGKKIN
jgi:N,N'-diacetyllegionaminate synthase